MSKRYLKITCIIQYSLKRFFAEYIYLKNNDYIFFHFILNLKKKLISRKNFLRKIYSSLLKEDRNSARIMRFLMYISTFA